MLFPQCRINRKDNSLQPNGKGLEIAILLGLVPLHLRRLKAISCSSTTPGSIRTRSDLKVNSAKRNKYVWKPALQSQPLLTHFTRECCDFTFWHIKYLVKMEREALRRGKNCCRPYQLITEVTDINNSEEHHVLAALLKPTGQTSALVLAVDLNWLHLQTQESRIYKSMYQAFSEGKISCFQATEREIQPCLLVCLRRGNQWISVPGGWNFF